MKPKQISSTTRKFGSSRSSNKVASFGAKRAGDITSRLKKAQTERKQLLRKEYASPDPLKKNYQQKGRSLDLKINRLKK